ncbi:hypothetical protein [Epilithonimonas hominis]|uniref:hypothetical protein n=1 Tax=Epilithonimonas hominis TaxID=420404 RepID=UPI0028A1AC6C|nr:hypothetical protein [Epilithonimonas hominis]
MKIDLTNNWESWKTQFSKKTILTAEFRLDKRTMVNLLSADVIFFAGNKYKVPEKQILRLLLNEQYGSTVLDLEQLEE